MDNSRLFDAIEFAAHAHRDSFRKATHIPYIVHPLAVARIIIECGASEDVVIASLLHDVVEDTSVTLTEIRAAFGDTVAEIVAGVTELPRRESWETRKRAMVESLESAPQDVLLIEVADKLDNLRDIRENLRRIGEVTWERFNRGREQQKWYYEQLADVFMRRIESACGKLLAHEFAEHVRVVFGE